jgi:hypothetical protein
METSHPGRDFKKQVHACSHRTFQKELLNLGSTNDNDLSSGRMKKDQALAPSSPL